ncbi:alpha/beta fold hydrolase [Streptomyces sp. NBC_01546]|uniref:alpha/beta fold hydrolase n=1 Tax=Streptomyces sp. NBC_01546 TaxID=2975872 RepID=UPI00386A2A86
MTRSYAQAPITTVSAANDIEYAYREVGEGGVPLVLLMHFRGNLDNWDPALVDALAQSRRVIAFDNTGVGRSSGRTPSTIAQMALDAIAFTDALDLAQVDVLGFSLGSFVAQEIALIRPSLARRVVLASAAPQGAPGMHGWAKWVIGAVGGPEIVPASVLDDAEAALAAHDTPADFFDAMLKRYSEHVGPTVLWVSARALYLAREDGDPVQNLIAAWAL